MSVNDKIQSLIVAMDIGDELAASIAQVPEMVQEAEDALVVTGVIEAVENEEGEIEGEDIEVSYTSAELSLALQGDLAPHMANRNNPHGVSAEQLGAYEKEETDVMVDSLLDEGLLPISRFGSLNYLPVNVNGAAEGNSDLYSNSVSREGVPMAIEKDGSLVYLRFATNGATRDLYYAYIDEFVQDTSFGVAEPTYTTRKWRPIHFPNNAWVSKMYGCCEGAILGVASSDTSPDVTFIARTNGTMNDAMHDFFKIQIEPTFNPFMVTSYVYKDPVAGERFHVVGWSYALGNPDDHPAFKIYQSEPIDTLVPGSLISLTQITSWTVTDGRNVTQTGHDAIRFFDKSYSTDPNDRTPILGDVTITPNAPFRAGGDLIPIIKGDNIRYVFADNCYLTGIGQASQQITVGYTFNVNFTTRTAEIDNKGNPLGVHADGGILIFDDTQGPWRSSVFTMMQSFRGGGGVAFYGAHFVTGIMGQNNSQVSLNRLSLVANDNDFIDHYTHFRIATDHSSGIYRAGTYTTRAKYFGPIGSRMRAPTLLSRGWTIVSCDGDNSAGSLEDAGSVDTSFGYTRNDIRSMDHQHRSDQTGGSYLGPTPKSPRGRLTDLGESGLDYCKLIQYTNDGDSVHAYGGYFVEGAKLSVPRRIDADAEGFASSAERIVIANSTLVSFKNSVLSSLGVSGQVLASKIELCYFDPTVFTGNLPSFAIIIYNLPNAELYTQMHEVNCTVTNVAGSLTITGISSRKAISAPVRLSASANGLVDINDNGFTRAGPVIVHEVAGGCMVAGGSVTYCGVVGNNTSTQWRLFAPNTAGANYRGVVHGGPSQGHYDYYFAVPLLGFGKIHGDGFMESDVATKCIFKPMAKTMAEYDSWTESRYPASSWRLVISTKDPVGFFVYFPQPLPVVILGTLYEIPATTIDLSTVVSNPANSTFHVFVELDEGGVPQYVFTTTTKADTIDSIYIGKVTTSATTVTGIELTKVTKIAEYRVSASPVGLGFAASPGTAQSTGSIDPDWY